MSETVISVKNISKRYRIGANERQADTLAGTIFNYIKYPMDNFRRLRSLTSFAKQDDESTIWALKDISFEVKEGEVLGIIGKNGAGKSTLLKILSRITYPTTGIAKIKGRVSSLLEVGTGFHSELTGRENVYLNGTILGMSKSEIDRKFDEIVDFSELEKFIDTPVRHYSSGMSVRLAFAVAAHLEPEIMIIDEVLAVGDLSYQQKCLKRLRQLRDNGMTIILVSHFMPSIQSSCSRALVIDQGIIKDEGAPDKVISTYKKLINNNISTHQYNNPINDSQIVSIEECLMLDKDDISKDKIIFGDDIKVKIVLYSKEKIESPMVNFGITRSDGLNICNFNNWYDNFKVDYIEGRCSFEAWLPSLRLIPGHYNSHVLLWHWGGGHNSADITGSVPIANKEFGGFVIEGPSLNEHDGIFQMPAIKWRFVRQNNVQESKEFNKESIAQVAD